MATTYTMSNFGTGKTPNRSPTNGVLQLRVSSTQQEIALDPLRSYSLVHTGRDGSGNAITDEVWWKPWGIGESAAAITVDFTSQQGQGFMTPGMVIALPEDTALVGLDSDTATEVVVLIVESPVQRDHR